jgi:hypothetical protein
MSRPPEAPPDAIHRWGRFEAAVDAPLYDALDPLRDVSLVAELTAPSGTRHRRRGFWDGEYTWRVRFAPDEVGTWTYTLTVAVRREAPVTGGETLTTVAGSFRCLPYAGDNPLYRHGPPRMGPDRRRLVHADGTPWLYLADTAWNGPLLSTEGEWAAYVAARRAQGFTAAQFIATQWHAAPDGGPDGPAWIGGDRVAGLNPDLFRRLDARLDALVAAGIAGVPVLLWAIGGFPAAATNPGNVLSEADCALLAGYQVARWGAHPVLFILNGDGRYTGEQATRWQRIGRAVFGEGPADDPARRPPVALHPGGRQWVGAEFGAESWLDVLGYQSGHGGDVAAWEWLVDGPPAREWPAVPQQAVINLEPCYEHHNRMAAQRGVEGAPGWRFTAGDVRRALYWSLLVSPTAGVTYGGHGVWGWDEGTAPPLAHDATGVPLHWQEALQMPGARQVRHLADAFGTLPWWTLLPDRELVRVQSGFGEALPEGYDASGGDAPADAGLAAVLARAVAARSADGRLAVLYLPAGGWAVLAGGRLAPGLVATWVDPQSGERRDGGTPDAAGESRLEAPDGRDWLLVLRPPPVPPPVPPAGDGDGDGRSAR